MTETPLHVRLDTLDFLNPADFAALDSLLRAREYAAGGELVVVEDQRLSRTRVLLQGWACRYKSFADGRRQILSFLVPGDIIGFYAIMLNRSDCGVEALTPMEMAVFPSANLVDALSTAPRLTLALSWIAGQSERMLDEQITRIGRRSAPERMAHLFLELFTRMRKAGAGLDEARRLPLTQAVLADALGMSHVHANRSFKTLARDGSVVLSDGNIVLEDVAALAKRANFDASYLEQPAVPRTTEKAIRDKT